MITNLLQKVLVSTAVSTVIGFSTILGGANSASALTIDSPTGNNGKQKAISNIVLYLKDNSGEITKLKIDNFSNVPGEVKSYDSTGLLQQYPSSKVVAYTVKAGNNKSGMGPGEGELVIVDQQISRGNLPTGSANETRQYSEVSQIQPSQQQSNPNQSQGSTTTSQQQPPSPLLVTLSPPNPTNSSTTRVSVPEPGSIAAIAIFGLGGLIRKKKISS